MTLSFSIFWSHLTLFDWKTPLRYRSVSANSDQVKIQMDSDSDKSPTTLTLDLKGKEVREESPNQSRVIAKLDFKEANKWASAWSGSIFLNDHTEVRLENIDYDFERYKIVVREGEKKRWSFRINPVTEIGDENFLVVQDGLTISANWDVFRWKNKIVNIECEENRVDLAKVLGALIWTLYFDFIEDRGSS